MANPSAKQVRQVLYASNKTFLYMKETGPLKSTFVLNNFVVDIMVTRPVGKCIVVALRYLVPPQE